MIVDFHTHMYPDEIVEKVKANIWEHGVLPHTSGTLSGLKESMQMAGIDLSVVHPIATHAGQGRKIADYAKSITDNSIISFGSVFPRDPDWYEDLKYCKKIGLPGIKLHPDFQEFYLKEKDIMEIVEAAVNMDLLVMVHVGVDPACLELVHSTPEMASALIDRIDSDKLILAHLGGHLYWDEVMECIAGKNCYIDTALAFGCINIPKFIKIVERHGYNRVLFGTDSPWGNQIISTKTIKAIYQIDQENLDKILYKNALRLLGREDLRS